MARLEDLDGVRADAGLQYGPRVGLVLDLLPQRLHRALQIHNNIQQCVGLFWLLNVVMLIMQVHMSLKCCNVQVYVVYHLQLKNGISSPNVMF